MWCVMLGAEKVSVMKERAHLPLLKVRWVPWTSILANQLLAPHQIILDYGI